MTTGQLSRLEQTCFEFVDAEEYSSGRLTKAARIGSRQGTSLPLDGDEGARALLSQSVSQSVSQSTNQSASQSVSLDSQSVSRSDSKSDSKSVLTASYILKIHACILL